MLRLYSYNAKWNLRLSLSKWFQISDLVNIHLVNVDYFFWSGHANWEAPILYDIDEQKSVSHNRFEHIQMQRKVSRGSFQKKNVLSSILADILNSSLNTWITMEIKIGRQYHGCPEKCLLITATILNQHGFQLLHFDKTDQCSDPDQ